MADKKADEKDNELLTLVRQQFEEFADGTTDARGRAEKCRDYRDGKQWTDAELATLKKRKQPAITDNKIADKCDALLGIERQMRTDPKAFPRTPQHDDDAEAATDALRFVADDNDFQRSVRQRCADNLMVEGLAAVEIVVEKYKGKKQPKICSRHIRWDRAYYDIHALQPDFSDKQYAGFFTWMDYEPAKKEWPDRVEQLDASWGGEATRPENDDKPRYVMSVGKRKRVQVFTHYFVHEGVWHKSVWCRGGFLEDPEPSKYLDEHGEPECCIEFQAVYRDSEGHPYGPVYHWLDRQDEINKRKSKMMHLLNTKQLLGPKGAFPEGAKKARDMLHQPDGYLEWNDGFGDKVQVVDNLNLAEGQWRLLVHAIDSLSTTGPNAALLGNTGSNSGIAKQVDQQAGTLTVAPLFEALGALQLRIYRHMWNRIRQFWTAETWVRVTDDEDNVKFVTLNQPVLAGDLMAEEIASAEAPPERKRQMVMMLAQDPRAQEPAMDDQGQPIIKHAVSEMDVDIILDEAPDVVTVQQEQFANLVEVAKTRPEVPFEVLLDLSQVRSNVKKRIMDKMSGADNPMAQKMAQMQERMGELEMALKAASVRKTEADASKSEAAAAESQIDAAVKVNEFVSPTPKPAGKTQVSVN